ncbi:MAG: hypothetical protein A3J83_05535 [Elusimicrobia bacterium RIFOXYA2_FULL_40_6]|nr:MAG: hypothetical protein A3J83_05535 [Elusimicrobia bacterium RIFOXYA2_FULL_40_6]
MKYPIYIQTINRNNVVAFCPVLHRISAEGRDIDSALKALQEKFLCYLHDDDVQMEVIMLDGASPMWESTQVSE